MNTFFRFFYEFISIFFEGLFGIFKGLFAGIGQMFNFANYSKIIDNYKESFNGGEWVFVIISVIALVLIALAVGILIFFAIKKIISPEIANYDAKTFAIIIMSMFLKLAISI